MQTVLQVLRTRIRTARRPLDEVVALMDPRAARPSLRDVPRPLRERTQDYLAGLTPDQLSAVRGLQTRLAIMSESHTGAFLAPPADPQRRRSTCARRCGSGRRACSA